MTVADIAQLITAIAALVAAIVSALSLNASRQNGKKLVDNGIKLAEVSENVDGKMEKLLAATGRAEHAEGKEAGRVEAVAAVKAAEVPTNGTPKLP